MNHNIFQLILREPYALLPSAVRHFHEARLGHFEGMAMVDGARGWLPSLLRKLNGLPTPASTATALTVKVIRSEVQERWLRKFSTSQFSSTLTRINSGNLLSENFGLFRFQFSLSVRAEKIHWQLVSWNFAGIPMLDALGPTITAWEGVNAEGNYQFAVKVEAPLMGVLVDYAGWVDCQ
jgi:Domain of unknown function (DUF4166)